MPAPWRRFAVALLLLHGALPWPAGAAEGYASRPDVRQFIAEMSARHGFASRQLESIFSRVQKQNSALRAMQPTVDPAQRSWQAYRAIFVNPQRIEAGIRFREANAQALARASKEYGVPADIIIGIIGVETIYGRNLGTYRVLEALTTLAFDYPARQGFFRSELEQFLLHAREQGLDAMAVRGSYAGAIGIPQFMPGSYRSFAVDFDGDGRRDLSGSAADAIGSVANFLKQHGWQDGEPVAARARVTGDGFRPLLDGGIRPGFRVRDLQAVGVRPLEAAPENALCALLELESPGQAPDYWLGFDNFFALTRYNRSSFYAIAVIELGRSVAQASNR